MVFFLAARARVEPETIIGLRLSGKTWINICTHHALSQEIFFVPVAVEVKGARYGRAYGHYKNKGRKEAKGLVLTDEEEVNLVNLKFNSEHYGYPAKEIIRMRDDGKNCIVVNDETKKVTHGKKKKPVEETMMTRTTQVCVGDNEPSPADIHSGRCSSHQPVMECDS